jgi:hypothetical protein
MKKRKKIGKPVWKKIKPVNPIKERRSSIKRKVEKKKMRL